MKKLNLLILKSYLGPFFLAFFIVMFILLMQFVWKYIDDFVGKGLEWYLIAELLFYTSATIVPMALPLAILFSSIMTFGNLAENYELAAIKSAGISLQKTMRPLIFLSFLLSIAAFYFANYIMPIAALKSGALLFDVRQQKPALDIKESVFYNGLDNYVIRCDKKSKDGKELYNLMIYDHSQRKGTNKLILADKGKLELSEDENYLLMTMYSGTSYDEVQEEEEDKRTKPLMRSKFEKQVARFDLSEFKMERSDEELFKDNYQMLNVKQLSTEIDTMLLQKNKRKELNQVQMTHNFKNAHGINVNPNIAEAQVKKKKPGPLLLKSFEQADQLKIIEGATNIVRSNFAFVDNALNDEDLYYNTMIRYQIEWHKKFTLPFSCLILFFIGAPLGAIIRKGGLGMPAVVSVGFFLLLYVLSIVGEKFAKEAVWTAFSGMWLSSAVLLPIGVFLTYKATRDSALFEFETYSLPIKKLFKRKE